MPSTITNALSCIFWAVVHICRDPILLAQIHNAIQSSTRAISPVKSRSRPPVESQPCLTKRRSGLCSAPHASPMHSELDINSLSRQPLLQSVYAEILRLYISVFLTRCNERSDIQINDWLLPRNKILLVSSDPAHFDPEIWNSTDGHHPPAAFWAERFLVRNDANKGVVPPKTTLLHNTKENLVPHEKQLGTESSSPPNYDTDTEAPRKFTLSGRNGSWIPYGGGSRACPGRHFAKQEILITVAMLLADFDVEILGDESALGIQSGRFGLGAQVPVGKIPVRIKRVQRSLRDGISSRGQRSD